MKKAHLFAALLCVLILPLAAFAQDQSAGSFGSEIASDFRYVANNGEADAEDIVTSPLHLPDLWAPDGLLRRPAFYYTLIGAGAAFGGAFAADQTVRSRLRGMSSSTADDLEISADVFTGGTAALLYA